MNKEGLNSEELKKAMRRFKKLEEEQTEVLRVLRKYMKVEKRWVFHPKEMKE